MKNIIEKIKFTHFHFSAIFSSIDEFKKFLPNKISNKNFYFIERIINENSQSAFINYILNTNLDPNELTKEILNVINEKDYEKILNKATEYSNDVKISAQKIQEFKQKNSSNELNEEEKEELIIYYLNIAFNYPTTSETIDKITYNKLIQIQDENSPPPTIIIRIDKNNENIKVMHNNKELGTQNISPEESFFFNKVIKILIPEQNPTHIALYSIYDGDITENNKQLYGNFLGWFATIIEQNELNNYNLTPDDLISSLRNFKTTFYNSVKEKFISTNITGKEKIIQKILNNIYLTRIWKKAEETQNVITDPNKPWILKDKILYVNFHKKITDAQKYLPQRLKINPTIYQENIPQCLALHFQNDFIPPNDENLKNELINFYINFLIDIYLELLKRREIRNIQILNAFSRIMERNFPHTLGSNVLSLLNSNLGISEFNIPNIKRTISYLHTRTEFLSLITSEFPAPWSYPAWFLKEIMKTFLEQSHLLKYIAKSENIRINKNSIKIYINNQKCSNLDSDFMITIPLAHIGFHAFFIILENIIRNSAKYRKNDNELEIYIRINTKEENVNFQIHDNIPKATETINEINNKLQEPLIDEEGKPILENLGIAEIKIATAFLNKKSIQETGEEKPDFIKAISINNCLAYEFQIPKPKEVLLILNNNSILNNKKEEFKKNSIYLLPPENLKNINLDFEFIAIEESLINKLDNLNAPERIIEINQSEIDHDPINFKKYIYKKWLQKLAKFANVELPKNIYLYIQAGSNIQIQPDILNELDEKCKDIINELFLKDEPETIPDFLTQQINPANPDSAQREDFFNLIIIPDLNTIQNINDQIYYLRHYKLPSSASTSINPLYLESLTGNSTHFYLISHLLKLNNDYLKFKLICQLLENALTKICIFDERTAQTDILEKPFFGGDDANFIEYLKKAGVFIIKQKDELSNLQNLPFYFLIIHKGLIDKKLLTLDELNNIKNVKRILITSGRAKPHELPPGTKFIPYSIIENLILSKPHHKFLLTQVLMNIK